MKNYNVKFKIIFLSIFLFGIFGLVKNSEAATYYVADKGSPSSNIANNELTQPGTWSAATNISSPASAGTAMANAMHDDIVIFLNGTYHLPTQKNIEEYRIPVLDPVNSGTQGHPVIFKAQDPLGVTLDALHFPGTNGLGVSVVIIGGYSSSYITWDGFKIQSENGAYLGCARIDSDGGYGVGVTIKSCEFVGASHSTGGYNNYAGIFISHCDYALIQNNYIHGYIETSGSHNTNGFENYSSTNYILENNTFYNNTMHIYDKIPASNANNTIRYNFLYGLAYDNASIWVTHDGTGSGSLMSVYQNVIVGGSEGISVGGSSATLTDYNIYNNTIYNPTGGGLGVGYSSANRVSWWNNIVYLTGNGTMMSWN